MNKLQELRNYIHQIQIEISYRAYSNLMDLVDEIEEEMKIDFGSFENLENLIVHLNDLKESQKDFIDEEEIFKEDEIFKKDVEALDVVINILEKLNPVSSTKTSPLYEYYHAKIKEIYIEKNKNYGNSFGTSVEKYGLIAALTRMSDKWNRLETLMTKEFNGNDESLIDTLLDLANYCLMTAVEIEKLNSKKPASK